MEQSTSNLKQSMEIINVRIDQLFEIYKKIENNQ